MKNQIAFCITGWHYPNTLYIDIKNIPNVDIFIISHKSRSEVPAAIFESFPKESILFKPNYGYDWGCFQQFLETNIWKSYEYIFFMHDDIQILNANFVEPCIQLLNGGYSIVGNGRPFDKRDWPRTHLKYYAHSIWKPLSTSFEHDIVRGSFFVTKRESLEKMGSFEVFWDKFRLAIGFGNYSLIASCGKFSDLFGQNAYAYLSNDYKSSNYIIELERGDQPGGARNQVGKIHRYLLNTLFMSWFGKLCKTYTVSKMKQKIPTLEKLQQKVMKLIIDLFAKR